jgi:hypothetical protein
LFLANAAGGRAPILHAHPPWATNMFAPEFFFSIFDELQLLLCTKMARSAVVSVEGFVFVVKSWDAVTLKLKYSP